MQAKDPYDDGIVVPLLRLVAGGDESAFRKVFDLYKSPFYNAAFKMIRSPDLAEDIVQEVFITLWNKRVLIGSQPNPQAYLLKILHNNIYQQFRKLAIEKRLKETVKSQGEEADENSLELFLLEKENRAMLEAIISQLPHQQQMVYRLAKQEGLTREDIAGKLGLSPNTVRNHLAAAVEFIRKNLSRSASVIIWMAIRNHL